MFFLSCVCYAFVRICLYMLCGHLLPNFCTLIYFKKTDKLIMLPIAQKLFVGT